MTYTFDHFIVQNPWRVDEQALNFLYFPRQVGLEIKAHLLTDEPLLIPGARESGKTALVQSLIQYLVKEERQDPGAIFYFNLDDPITADFFRDGPRVLNFLRCFKPRDAGRIFLIIDEAQYLSAPIREQLLKESGLKLIWTTSQASLNQTFRGRGFRLNPCNFREFLGPVLKRGNYYLPDLKDGMELIPQSQSYVQILTPAFEEYLLYGGYPKVVRLMTPQHKQEALREIIRIQLNGISRSPTSIGEPDKFVNLLTLLAAQDGQLLNLQALSRQTQLDYRTLKRYLGIMVEHYLISLVYPFRAPATAFGSAQESGRLMGQGVPLVYFNDPGLRNAYLASFQELALRPDRTILLEHFLFQELIGGSEVTDLGFIRTRQDRVVFSFVVNPVRNEVSNGVKGQRYLAASRYDFPQNRRGLRALVNLSERLKPDRVIVLTSDYVLPGKYGPGNFIFLPTYWAWALPEVLQD